MSQIADDFPSVMDLLEIGLGVFDDNLKLTYCNRAFRTLRGYPEALCQEGVGLAELLIFNAERGDFGPGDPKVLADARMVEISNAGERFVEHVRPDGQVLRVHYQRPERGGLMITYQDRTAERQAEAALRDSEERHALVTDATTDGFYDWDVTADMLYVSDHVMSYLDFDASSGSSRMWAERIHPDDYPAYRDAVRTHFKGEKDAIEREYRIRGRNGDWRWVHDRGVGVRNQAGRVTRLVGAVRDITEAREAVAELDETRSRLFLSLSSISDGILLTDAENRIQMFNDRYVELFQEASGEIDMSTVISSGRPFVDVVRDTYQLGVFRPHPEGVDGFIADRLKAWETDAAQWELQLANGTWILSKERKMPDGGRVSVYTEITDLKQREAEVAAAGERLITSLESLSDGILIVDSERRLELFNRRYVEIFSQACGKDAGPIVYKGRPFFEMLREGYGMGMFKPYPGGVDAWIETRIRAWDKPASQLEIELANGTWLLINDREMPGGGRISIYADITNLKRREAETAAARQRFEEAIEAISSGFVLWDADDRLVISNARYRTYFSELADMVVPGNLFNDIIRMGIERGMFPLAEGDIKGYLAGIAAKRRDAKGEVREQCINGLWLQITDHRTADGGIVSIYTDITELKAQQEEIAHQTALLELTLENMGQGISLVGKDLRTTAFNQKFLELMDFPPEKFPRGFTMEQAFRFNAERGEYGPGDVEEQVAARLELAAKFQPHQFQRVKPDGTVLEITGIPIEGGGMVSTYTDITERRKAEDALRMALAEFNAISEHIDYGVLFTGPDLRARIVNKAFRELWGMSQEFIDTRPHMREIIEFNRHTGLYTVPKEEFDDWLDGRIASIEEGDVPPMEIVRGDGKILSYQVVSLPDGGRMMTYFDITELKNRELDASRARDAAQAALADLQQAQERLVQSEKMASLGQLTAGIAHEIKNPLNFVNNFAKLSAEMIEELEELLKEPIKALEEDDKDDAEDLLETVRENLKKINEHGQRADSIIKNMLLHSREGPSERRRVNLNAIAEEALNLAYHGARAEDKTFNIEIIKDIDPEVGEIECYPQDLMRVFLNLCTNGMYAATKRRETAGDGFQPTISLKTRLNGDNVEIEVRDNGTGIPDHVKEKVFLPFFTTKPAGEGTGLGLSISYDTVVKQHGGMLTVDSEPDQHTAFTVTVPRTIAAD